MQKAKGLLQFFLGIPLTIVAFFFVGKFIYESRSQIIESFKQFDSLLLTSGLFFLLLFFFFRSLLWKSVLDREGYQPSVVESTYLLAASEIKRYVPVGVLAIIGRVNSFQIYKIPAKTTLRLIFYESVLFFVSSIAAAIPGAYFLLHNKTFDSKLVLLIVVLAVFAFSVVFIFIKKKNFNIFDNVSKYLQAFILMLTAWVFFGLGNFLILTSFYPLSSSNVVFVSSFFVLSWLVGYVAFIFPLGLGIREGFLTYALTFAIPVGTAAALSVISRVAFVLMEVLFVIVVFFIYKHLRSRPKIDAATAIFIGMIAAFISFFTILILRTNAHPVLIFESLILGSGAILIYKNAIRIIIDRNLTIVIAGSYLVNPAMTNALMNDINLNRANPNFLIIEASTVLAYVFLSVVVKVLIERKILGPRRTAGLIIAISILLAFLYGNLPGALSSYGVK